MPDADDASLDLDDGVVLLTGGTRGIGRAAARMLADLGAEVLLVGRDVDAGERTARDVRAGGGDATFLRADLARQAEVRRLADEVLEGWDRLDVLVHNAGTLRKAREPTGDGVNLTMAVNVVAPWLLTVELADRLAASAPARVVHTSSQAHWNAEFGEGDDVDAFMDPASRRFDWWRAYGRSKMALNALTAAQAARFDAADAEVTANAFHPGFIPGTNLAADLPWYAKAGWTLLKWLPVGKAPVEVGAQRLVHVAAGPGGAGNGRYLVDDAPTEPKRPSFHEGFREDVWAWCARACGEDPDAPLVGPGTGDGPAP